MPSCKLGAVTKIQETFTPVKITLMLPLNTKFKRDCIRMAGTFGQARYYGCDGVFIFLSSTTHEIGHSLEVESV